MLVAFTLLLVLAATQGVFADVWLKTSTFQLDPIPDMPADFGPDIPDSGTTGYLRLAVPEDACKPLVNQEYGVPWVALISRQQIQHSDNCTFDVKVAHAEAAGAVGAMVYDNLFESLIIMSKPSDHPNPGIPAVFVTAKAGLLMRKLLSLDVIEVTLTPVDTSPLMSLVVSAACGLIASTLVMVTVYSIRSWHNWRTARAPPLMIPVPHRVLGPSEVGLAPEALQALPVLIYAGSPHSSTESHHQCSLEEGTSGVDKPSSCGTSDIDESVCPAPPPGVHAGETKRVCTICLEQYEDADKIRILPCYHRFHMSCVDQWLSTKRVCPVCKHDSAVSLSPAEAGAGGQGSGVLGLRAIMRRATAGYRSLAGAVRSWRTSRARPARDLAEPLLPVGPTLTAVRSSRSAGGVEGGGSRRDRRRARRARRGAVHDETREAVDVEEGGGAAVPSVGTTAAGQLPEAARGEELEAVEVQSSLSAEVPQTSTGATAAVNDAQARGQSSGPDNSCGGAHASASSIAFHAPIAIGPIARSVLKPAVQERP